MNRKKTLLVTISITYILALTIALILDKSIPFVYLICMYSLLVYPLFISKQINGKYLVLFSFLTMYFLYFGLADLLALLPDIKVISSPRKEGAILTSAESAILLGGISVIAGYSIIANFTGRKERFLTRDWPENTIVVLGILCWVAGIIGTGLWQFVYSDRNINATPSPITGTLITFARYLQPLGIAMIAYAYFTKSSKLALILLIMMVSIEIPFGFLADSKELSLKGLVIIILVRFLLYGNVPIKWLLPLLIFSVATFSLALAYRYEILQQRGQLRTEAASNIGENIEKIKKSKVLKAGLVRSSAEYLISRLNMKNNMVLIVTKTGNPVPYQKGYTIKLLLYAWIPRIIYPNKPEISVGRRFNQAYKISLDPNTYISTSFPGEFYWNFGLSGLVIGMFLFGGLLGLVGSLFNLSRTKSITRLLVLITTIYYLCLRFETGFALEINQWSRVLIISVILHMIFKKRAVNSVARPFVKAASLVKMTQPQPRIK